MVPVHGFKENNMGSRIPALCLCLLLLVPSLAAQQKDKPQQPPPSTPPPGGQQPTQPPPQTPRIPEQERRQEIERPLFLAGKVMLDDGNPPPESVRVEMLCGGQIRYQIHTDTRGYFSFEVGENRPYSVMDASVSGARETLGNVSRSGMMGRTDLSGCELRALLPGFQSERINLGHRSSLDNPDVGTILLRRQGGVSGTTVSLNTLKAPDKARKAYEKGKSELLKKKPNPAKAVRELEKATDEYPEFAAAWALLGDARLAQADEVGARDAFSRALEADPQYLTPYLALASLEIKSAKWAETAQITGEVLKQNPYIGRAHFLHALANYQLGKLEVAEESALEVKKTNEIQQYPVLYLILGDIHARKGDISTAATEFRRYLHFLPDASNAAQVRSQLQDWESKGLVKRE
jgi:predicted negative regulator of RcsB-dependent stress response